MDTAITSQTEFNFDLAELIIIFNIKAKVIDLLERWELETAYWTLRRFRGEIDAKLPDTGTEQTKINSKLQELEEVRKEWLGDQTKRAEFYVLLDDFYLLLCRTLKEHGVYFREKADPRRAVNM